MIKPVRKTENPKIIYALLRSNVPESDDSSPSMRDLTLSWLRFGYQKVVFEAGSVQSLLQMALEQGGDFCVIQSPGNIISEEWKLPHWNCEDFYQCVKNYVRSSKFLICANFKEIDAHFYIDTLCFIVNLKVYKDVTRHLKSHEFIQLTPSVGDGWVLIDPALTNHVTITELPTAISNKRLSLIDEPKSSEDFNKKGTKKSAFISGIEAQLQYCRQGVFLWNIESYDDIQKNKTGLPQHSYKIRNLYCVAAGFKPNMLLQRHGYEEQACITFFDYSNQALNIRRKLMEEWDGLDYPDFCKAIINSSSDGDIFFQLWDGLSPSQINWRDVEQLWLDELAHWGGAQAFQQQWQKHRTLQCRYILCDLVKEPSKLITEIHNSPQSVIWWSNAFFTVTSNWTLSIQQRKRYFESWIQQLSETAPDCQIYGADYINRPINNIRAREYYKRLSVHVANNTEDELSPYQEEALPLRF